MIHFPIQAAEFLAEQSRLAGRELSAAEAEIAVMWVTPINYAYEEGLANDRDALDEDLAFIDSLRSRSSNVTVSRFRDAIRNWLVRSFSEGATAREKRGVT